MLLLAIALVPSARACGYHDPSGINLGMLNLAYPDALYVRTAVWLAQMEGVIERSAPSAPSDTAESPLQLLARLRQAQMQLEALRRQVEGATRDRALPAFSVVLIGPMLWTRFESRDHAVNMAVHATGPARDDVVVVTDAPVVAALADDRLSLQTAREHGLVRFYGAPDRVEQVAHLLDRHAPAQVSTLSSERLSSEAH